MATMFHPLVFRLLPGIIAALSLGACGPGMRPAPPRANQVLYEWNDDGGPGEISVRINISNQIATIHRGQREVGWCYVATGRDGHGTPSGTYHVSEMVVDKISNRWGWHENELGEVVTPSARYNHPVPPGARFMPAPMPYWMRLTSYGIGMHGGYIPNPGMPASAGCIRLPQDFAPLLYQEVKIGTRVTITR